jgi:uncharacterized protein YjbI with pentapeptide repeats
MPALLLLLLLSVATLASPAVPSTHRSVAIQSLDDAAEIDDPRALLRAAAHHLEAGDAELAEALFGLAVDREEISKYIGASMRRPYFRRALVAERMGRHDEAAAAWREGWGDDPHMTVLLLRMRSQHPERNALVNEGLAHIRSLVEQAAAGEPAVIYKTSKGADRQLKVMSADEALAQIRSGDGHFRYTWIQGHLDLAGVPSEQLPKNLTFNRTVLDGLTIPDKDVHSFRMKAIVLGDLKLGKTWTGTPGESSAIPASRFDSLMIQETMVLGRAVFQDVEIRDRIAYFPLSSFEGETEADFRGLQADGMADFRFSVFRHGANFKDAHFTDAVYFGHTRYLEDVTFRGMYSEQDVYFNSARFEGAAAFDRCEWARAITFENATFDGPVTFNSSESDGRINMSRTVFADTLEMKEMSVGGMDFIGAWLQGPARFIDVQFLGKVRFSLDDITRSSHLADPVGLLSLYRDYQGDKDAMEPLTTRSSYGVEHVDDLIARIDSDISFANSVFRGFCIFERVRFGRPDAEDTTVAEFYNTQFRGEAHFERTHWHSVADFETIFASELSFNEATFHHSLVLDDANVSQRATLTDAAFMEAATLSFYAAEIASFQIDRSHIEKESGEHRLFYEQCAQGAALDPADIRLVRLNRHGTLSTEELSEVCHDRGIDEWVLLKGSFGDRAMTTDEDWAYWHIKHTEMMKDIRHASWPARVGAAAITWPLFELSFGWGVRLGNLAITSLLVTIVFAWLYRVFCPDTVVAYRGDDVPMRDIPWHGLIYISLQSLGAFNTGWDFGEDDWKFQYLNTIETFIGIIVLTFFVGAYTRMILA